MNWLLWAYTIITILSLLGAALAWIAKLRWAKEYSAAKDEIIKAKEAQIDLLKKELENVRELSPPKLREYFLSMKEQLEEFNDKLKENLKNEIEARGQLYAETERLQIELTGKAMLAHQVEMENMLLEKAEIENVGRVYELLRTKFMHSPPAYEDIIKVDSEKVSKYLDSLSLDEKMGLYDCLVYLSNNIIKIKALAFQSLESSAGMIQSPTFGNSGK